MLYAIAAGTLIDDPAERTSSAGKRFVAASVRVPLEREDAVLVSVVAFDDETRAALEALRKGDALTVKGTMKPTTWTGRDGAERHGLSMVVQRLMTGEKEKKPRTPKKPGKGAGTEDGGFPDEAGDLSGVGQPRGMH